MVFNTACKQKRPIRLSEETRAFALESLQGRYGDQAIKTPCVNMDSVAGFGELSFQQKYDSAIMKIASEAPLRICEAESVSGSATLGAAINHVVPAFFGGKPITSSISHLTLDFKTVVFKGIDYLQNEIKIRLECDITEAQREQLVGMDNVIRAMRIWHKRYVDALAKAGSKNTDILRNVPFYPATNFREAVQSLWFTFAFERLCGNWPGIGRIDEILGVFLEKDLNNSAINIDEAREYLAGMFIKGCEWIQSNTPTGSGDAQHYQNIVLSGVDLEGNDITNEVTYLVLDILEELPIGDFPVSVRINKNSSQKLLRRVCEIIRHGGGVIAVYNEDLVIDSLVKFGYPLKEARCFANDGCWEVQIPGKTYFSYCPFDSLRILLYDTLGIGTGRHACFDSFEQLYSAFCVNLRQRIESIYKSTIADFSNNKEGEDWSWKPSIPCSAVSLLEEGCIDSGRSYLSGGPEYVVVSPHIGGAPDVGNSLYAIDRLVFEEQRITLADLLDILENNWDSDEGLRQYVLNKITYYGNDDDRADMYTVRVLNDFADMVANLNDRTPIKFPAGVSTFGRQIEWSPQRAATPFGRKAGEILSGNTSPTPNTDTEGVTASIKSYCKINLKKLANGAALDIKLYPSSVDGENGLTSLQSLLKGFVLLGGFFMQLDVIDKNTLLDAQKHPENYKTLSVRVSGWNARFVTLNSEWQRMIIERDAKKI